MESCSVSLSLRPESPDRSFRVHTHRKNLPIASPSGIEDVSVEISGYMFCMSGLWIENTQLPIPGDLIQCGGDQDLPVAVHRIGRQWDIAHSHFITDSDFDFR